MCIKFLQVLCYFVYAINKINVFKLYQVVTFPSFLYTKEKRDTRSDIFSPVINSLCQVLSQHQKLSAFLSPCVHLGVSLSFFFFFSLSAFGGMFIFQSVYLGITYKLYFFSSPTFRLFIPNISKFCYFFLFLS